MNSTLYHSCGPWPVLGSTECHTFGSKYTEGTSSRLSLKWEETRSRPFNSYRNLRDGPNDNSMLDMLIGYSCIQICILLSLLLLLLLARKSTPFKLFY